MPQNLYVRITRPLPLRDLLELAVQKLQQMLRIKTSFTVGVEVPPGARPNVAPSLIPVQPKWCVYAYLENINDSLVEIHISVLSAQSGQAPTVIYFGELRTVPSRIFAAALAIAAAELLGTEVLDLEHIWINRAQASASDFLGELSLERPQTEVRRAMEELGTKMRHT